LLLVSGVAALIVYQHWPAVLMLWSTAFLLAWGHFRYGSIIAVLWALRKGDVEKAGVLLANIRRPQWLSRRYQAYYYFALGLVSFYKKELNEGALHFQKALDLGLSGKQELAITHLNLAHASYLQKDFAATRAHIDLVHAQNVEDLYLKERVAELEKQLQNQ
jgi:hypothetical protein